MRNGFLFLLVSLLLAVLASAAMIVFWALLVFVFVMFG
jgi:hypothetical protein